MNPEASPEALDEIIAAVVGVGSTGSERIGEGYGLSGVVHRVRLADGGSVVVKFDDAALIAREMRFFEAAGATVAIVPRLLGGWADDDGRGVVVMEDVAPAEQGDVLAGCDDDRAVAVARAFGALHAATWGAGDEPEWSPRPFEVERWEDRVAVAAERHPDLIPPDVGNALLGEYPERLARAIERLEGGPHCWVQIDAHLDNVLWRPDGSAVIVDWTHATVGSPAIDLASLLVGGGLEGPAGSPRRELVLAAHRDELISGGVASAEAESAVGLVEAGALVMAQGVVGWAGRRDRPSGPDRVERLTGFGLRRSLAELGYSGRS